jgi:hypothetical protein
MALGFIGGTIDHAKRLVDLYRTAGRDAGHPEEQLTVAITSHFYVGETQEHALGASGIFGAPHSAEEMRRRLAIVARAA